jgi:hypothetical protein
VASGVFDLFSLPLQALATPGPSDGTSHGGVGEGNGAAPRRILRGVVQGWTSLLSGLSQGTLQSFAGEGLYPLNCSACPHVRSRALTPSPRPIVFPTVYFPLPRPIVFPTVCFPLPRPGLASTLSRNLDRLSLDDDHVRQREVARHMASSRGVGAAVWAGLRDVTSGVLGGVAGAVTAPIAAGRAEGWRGVAKGLGIGLLGMVAKPASGALDLASSASQGILNSAGIGGRTVRNDRPARVLVTRHDDAAFLRYKVLSPDVQHSYVFHAAGGLLLSGSGSGGQEGPMFGSQLCATLVLCEDALCLVIDAGQDEAMVSMACPALPIHPQQPSPPGQQPSSSPHVRRLPFTDVVDVAESPQSRQLVVVHVRSVGGSAAPGVVRLTLASPADKRAFVAMANALLRDARRVSACGLFGPQGAAVSV